MGKQEKLTTRQVTLCGMFAAFSLVGLLLACVQPTGRLATIAVAGLFPAFALVSAGFGAGLLCWAGCSVLALILLPIKECALLYLLLMGLYPVLKSRFEQFHARVPEWICKLAYFNAMLAVVYVFLKTFLFSSLPAPLTAVGPLFLCGNVIFVLYDVGLSKVIAFYTNRIDLVLRKR